MDVVTGTLTEVNIERTESASCVICLYTVWCALWLLAGDRRDGLARRKTLVERFGNLPAGMSKADAEAILQFLYGAFDRRMAKQVRIVHPYLEVEGDNAVLPELTIFEFCRWLETVAA